MDRKDHRVEAQEDEKLSNYEAFGKIFHSVLAEARSWRRDAQHPLFVAIDNLLGEPLSIKDLVLTERYQNPVKRWLRKNAGAANWGLTICQAV